MSLDATFQEYASSLRLRRVLREIKTFSEQFTPVALDAFLHLTAVPVLPPTPPVEARPEAEAKVVIEEAVTAKAAVMRGEVREAGVALSNVRTIAGIEFIRIPAGKFLMGSKDDNKLAFDNEKPQHTVEIPYDYWIARYEVTNEQFARFVEEAKYKFDQGQWQNKADHPVVNVTWHDALAYCKWLSDNLDNLAKVLDPSQGFGAQGFAVRLPTEAEWEKAARGEYGNEWPWGNDFDKNKCNSSEGRKGGTTPVDTYSPQGDSPYGVSDMVGNVWEWTSSLWGSHVSKPQFGYPYNPADGREKLDAPQPVLRVVRGGSWLSGASLARCSCRPGSTLGGRGVDRGFRCVLRFS
jgi:formylglycine-generating enzyme required for sulfatase activity